MRSRRVVIMLIATIVTAAVIFVSLVTVNPVPMLSDKLNCTRTYYTIHAEEVVAGATTGGYVTTITQTSVKIYSSTTNITQMVGISTSTTIYPTTTQTGYIYSTV